MDTNELAQLLPHWIGLPLSEVAAVKATTERSHHGVLETKGLEIQFKSGLCIWVMLSDVSGQETLFPPANYPPPWFFGPPQDNHS